MKLGHYNLSIKSSRRISSQVFLLIATMLFAVPNITYAEVTQGCSPTSSSYVVQSLDRNPYNAGDTITATLYSPPQNLTTRGGGWVVSIYAKVDGVTGQYFATGELGGKTPWTVSTQLVAPAGLGQHYVEFGFSSGHGAGVRCSIPFTVVSPSGTINVSSSISSSWTITGPVTIPGSGTSQSSPSQPAGAYTITWNPVAGHTTPPSQSLTLISGGMITFSGTYTALASCPLPWGGSIASGNSTTAYQSASVMSPLACTSQSRLCTNGTLAGTYANQNCSVIPATCTLPWGGSIASGNSTTAYQSASVMSPLACTSQSRLCTNGTLTGTYANQSCVVNPASVCSNGICEAGENPLTCPQDCKVKIKQF